MQPVHLIILIHGLYGTPSNLAVIRSELEEAGRHAELPIAAYTTTSFTGSHTWDGIDVNAHRAAKEVCGSKDGKELKGRLTGRWID